MGGERQKFEPPRSAPVVDNSGILPDGYGDHRLIIMVRDPYWFFGYWELSGQPLEAIRAEHGADIWDRGAFILRVYDTTDSADGLNKSPYIDVDVHRMARQWYVKVPKSGRVYQAELGLRLPDGRFVLLVRSNRIRMPFGRVSEKTDSQWMAVGYGQNEQEKWDKFLEATGGLHDIGRGSAEISRTMAQRWEFLKSVFSGSVGSSGSWPSSSSFVLAKPPEEDTQ
jgi:hypothetical protein